MLLVYLIFSGTCREAMEFYADGLGGKITHMRSFEESPLEVTERTKHLIFDSELQAQDIIIKASDSLPENDIQIGTNFSLFMTFENEEAMKEKFTKLSEGGTVIMPLEEPDTTANFCMFKDRYNIQWMMVLNKKDSILD